LVAHNESNFTPECDNSLKSLTK